MQTFSVKIESSKTNEEYNFECFENEEPIEIGDVYLFSFCGIWDAVICETENEIDKINKHDRPYKTDIIDAVHSFWRRCYKVKTTNYKIE